MTTPSGNRERRWTNAVAGLGCVAIAAATIVVGTHGMAARPGANELPALLSAAPLPALSAGAIVVPAAATIRAAAATRAASTDRTTAQTCSGAPNIPLTAVSFNIHSGLGRDHGQRLEAFAQTLKEIDADLYLLQEVDVNRLWSRQIDQPAYLAGQLGYHYAFGTNVLRPGNRRNGNAILSRYPIIDSNNLSLPNVAGKHQRGLLRAEIDVRGIRVAAYATHLEHTSYALRQKQAAVIAAALGGETRPLVIGGDFNSMPGSLTMDTMRKAVTDTWAAVGQGSGMTQPAGKPNKRIDYLLSRGVVPVTAEVVATRVSDHRPVLAEYEIPTDTAPTACLPPSLPAE